MSAVPVHFGSPLGTEDSPALARLMPWVMSVLLHLGVFLIAVFVGIASQKPAICGVPPTTVTPLDPVETSYLTVPDLPQNACKPPGPARKGALGAPAPHGPVMTFREFRPQKSDLSLIGIFNNSAREFVAPGNIGLFSNVFSKSRGTGCGGDGTGLGDGGGGGGNGARDLVFVIDRSGSMYETFDQLKHQMLLALSHMTSGQKFHVIMFSSGKPIENPPRRLVPVEEFYLRDVAKFLTDAQCGGQTDPLPAIRRAFEVLAGSKERPQVICLLTDGAFTDNEQVRRQVAELNRGRGVQVFTYLYGQPDDSATAVMKRIAQENRGQYKYLNPN